MRTGVGMGLLRRLATIPLLVVCAALLLGVSGAGATGGRPVKNGRYKGVVGPGWAISFRVSADGTKVDQLVAAFDVGCNGGASSTPAIFHFGSLSIHDGRFAGRSSDAFGKKVSEVVHISGSFAGRTSTGKVSDTSNIASLPSCTETSPFTATAH
ncbi:MAG TPA: hypothetical protein VGN25_05305 [Solirubrobacteraceae bacterium]|nr:hypothetical protein [Solirubrobacteraceae bacterium]